MSFRRLIALFFIASLGALVAAQDTFDTQKGSAMTQTNFPLSTSSDCRFSGSFEQQKKLLGLDQHLISNGVFFHDCNVGVIWKTLAPIEESLVLQKAGKAFAIRDGVSEELKSVQSRQINELIVALIAGDKESLTSLFEIETADENMVTLLPKNRRLKRAVESIKVSTMIGNGYITMLMKMLDRNGQETQINSSILQVYEENPLSLQADCLQTGDTDIIDCGLLQAP